MNEEQQNQTTTLRDLTRGNPDFCEDMCFGLTISTKSLNKEADSVYGLVLSDSQGNILYKAYVGQDVPDSALGFDRLERVKIDECTGLSDVIPELLRLLPKGAKLFSSHAGTWASVLWQRLVEAYPTLPWDDSIEHIDIRGLAKNVGTAKVPYPGMSMKDYCTANIGSRVSLFEVANSFGVRDALAMPAPESKAMAVGRLINVLFGKSIRIPK